MRLVLAWDADGRAPEGWGSHVVYTWDRFEPKRGVYRLDLFEKALNAAVRPCYLQIAFSMFDKKLGVPVDYTPNHHKRTCLLQVGGKSGYVPNYSAEWAEAYSLAVEELAKLKAHPNVMGYWHAAGWNQETQVATNNAGGAWGDAAKVAVKEDVYIDFLLRSTRRALAAWGNKPVYLPGVPGPASMWGRGVRRDVIATLLEEGAGYMNCALQTDFATAFGIGERAGLAAFDIATRADFVGFEEGNRAAPQQPLELYWMLMHALAWDADFVNLYSTISAKDYATVEPLLPEPGVRWIVFRDKEHKEQSWRNPDGKWYGTMGEPGCWANGIVAPHDLPLTFAPSSYAWDRWTLRVHDVTLRLPGWTDSHAEVTAWCSNGARTTFVLPVNQEEISLPGGLYHRVDVRPTKPQPLTLEQRVERIEAWINKHEEQAHG